MELKLRVIFSFRIGFVVIVFLIYIDQVMFVVKIMFLVGGSWYHFTHGILGVFYATQVRNDL